MRYLLDECVPRRLAAELSPHAVRTVREAGWQGVGNGRLLALAAGSFDAFVTVDVRLGEGVVIPSSLRVVVVRSMTNRYADLEPRVPDILRALDTSRPGERSTVG